MVLNLQAGFVKYYRESVDNYNIPIKQAIYNPKSATTYVKITLVNQGSLGFTFDGGTTEKTLSIGANSSITASETLVPSTTPTETMKDNITLKIEYFKNSDYSGKFGEDTINYQINYYIQNSDGSWTSSQYPNEDDIVYDAFSSWDGTTATGINGNAKIVASGGVNYGTTAGIINDTATIIGQSKTTPSYGSASFTVNVVPYYLGGTPIKCKFFAGFTKTLTMEGDTCYFRIQWSNGFNITQTSSEGVVWKFLYYPSAFYPRIQMYGYTETSHSWTETVTIKALFDGLVLFNPLP